MAIGIKQEEVKNATKEEAKEAPQEVQIMIQNAYPQTIGFSMKEEMLPDGSPVVAVTIHSRTEINNHDIHHLGPKQGTIVSIER